MSNVRKWPIKKAHSPLQGWKRAMALCLLFAFSLGSSGLVLRRDLCLRTGNSQWLIGFAFSESCRMAETPMPNPPKSCCKKGDACSISTIETTDISTCCTYEQVQLRVASFLPNVADSSISIPLLHLLIFSLLGSNALLMLHRKVRRLPIRDRIPIRTGQTRNRLFCVWRL